MKQMNGNLLCRQGNKISLCRFYLRGLCPIQRSDCGFAHGIDDLLYKKPIQNQRIHYEFTGTCCNFYQLDDHKITQQNKQYCGLLAFYQKNINYIHQSSTNIPENLTLEIINSNRKVKKQLRSLFHQQQFDKFMALLEINYEGQGYLEQQFVKDQYYRVGFNKLMTRIKFGHLEEYLSSNKNGYFKINTVLVPEAVNRRKNLYLKKKSKQSILQQYCTMAKQYLIDMKEHQQQTVSEQQLKLHLMTVPRNWNNVPPINQLLTDLNMTLRCLIENQKQFQEIQKLIVSKQLPCIKSEQEILNSLIAQSLEESIKIKGYCLIETEIYEKMMDLKFNNKNLIKKILNKIVAHQQHKQTLSIIKLPQIGKVAYHLQLVPQIQEHLYQSHVYQLLDQQLLSHQPIVNSNQYAIPIQSDTQSETNLTLIEVNQDFGTLYSYKDSIKVYLIEDGEQLWHHLPQLRKAQVLSIDLQGSLHDKQKGYIALIQIYDPSSSSVYLIDIYTIRKSNNIDSVTLIDQILKWILLNDSVVKIFHDCRGDIYALLYLLPHPQTSMNIEDNVLPHLRNIFDTSVAHLVINQFKSKHQIKQSDLSSPSLNKILVLYGQKQNSLKHKYHEIWDKGLSDPASQRPLTLQFMQYCIMDVLGLPQVYMSMKKNSNIHFLKEMCEISMRKHFEKQ